MRTSNQALQIAQDLKKNYAGQIDLRDTNRRYSYGEKGNSMLEASRGDINAGFKVTNDTDDVQVLYIAPFQMIGQTVDVGSTTVIPKLGTSNVVFATGNQLVAGADKFAITEINPDKPLKSIRGVADMGGLMIAGLHLKSRGIVAHVASGADDSNYENPIQMHWINAFDKVKTEYYELRLLQDANMNSPQFAKVNFLAEGKNVLISPEHLIEFTINPRTELTVTMSIGLVNSPAQRLHRDTRDGVKVLRPLFATEK